MYLLALSSLLHFTVILVSLLLTVYHTFASDKNEFMSQSGWFTFPGMPQDMMALSYVLAKKCRLSYEKFMDIREAVYAFTYMQGEKVSVWLVAGCRIFTCECMSQVFVGKANILHIELSKHFESFGKKKEDIRQIDDELCRHTYASGWEITIWPLQVLLPLDREHYGKRD